MIEAGLTSFKDKHIMLLQGPIGPFFHRFARDLEAVGAQVHKVNFNGGDWLFYPANSILFRGKMEDWPEFFEQSLIRHDIDIVMMFGDCRPLHKTAHQIAQLRGIEVGVFEEGYVRPDFITLERFGANDNSLIPRECEHYHGLMLPELPPVREVGKPFWYGALWANLYYLASTLLWPWFWRYQHHRPLNLFELWPWIRSLWRKWRYAIVQRHLLHDLVTNCSGRYFLVPLQVNNDAQIHFHSGFASVKGFIQYLIHSFAVYAPQDTILVIKHHPMDRGYHDYTRFIATVSRENGVEARVHYVHDLHLPTLFDHARGVVVINSTVGLSAINHDAPTKVCGKALYDMPGLTYQGSLDKFWKEAQSHIINQSLLKKFMNYLITHTQINGSFYKRVKVPDSHAGVCWNMNRVHREPLIKSPNVLIHSAASSKLRFPLDPSIRRALRGTQAKRT